VLLLMTKELAEGTITKYKIRTVCQRKLGKIPSLHSTSTTISCKNIRELVDFISKDDVTLIKALVSSLATSGGIKSHGMTSQMDLDASAASFT
jgi:hypothetical protein